MGITDLPFQGFVESVRKSNLAMVDQWSKEAGKGKAEAEKASHDAAGGRQGDAGKGQGAGQAGGHSADGH
ncbi:hypothetical protein D3C87_1562140 [compost metagenome]